MMKKDRRPILVRIPEGLYRTLRMDAMRNGMSINALITARLAAPAAAPETGPADAPAFAASSSEQEVQTLVDSYRAHFGPQLVGLVLFGSVARGNAGPASDFDLLVVLHPDVVLNRDIYSDLPDCFVERREVAPMCVRLPRIDSRLGSLWYEVALEGVVLFDTGWSVSRLLARVRRLISSRKATRRVSHGHPYWVTTATSDLESEGKSDYAE